MELLNSALESTNTNVSIGVGQAGTPGQGPHMILAVKAVDGQIMQARFSTYGCPAAQACGQFVCEDIENRRLEHAAKIDEDYIIRSIGRMPLGREHCPALAVSALKMALNQMKLGQQEDFEL